MKTNLITTICSFAVLCAVAAHASLTAPHVEDESAVRQAESVLVGTFTGRSTNVVREYRDQFDDAGQPIVLREVVTSYEFDVSDVVSGDPTGRRISVNVVGGSVNGVTTPFAVQVPKTGARVVLGVVSDAGHDGEHVIVHGRVFDARSDEQLADLRTWVELAREPEPTPPERIMEERLAALEAPRNPLDDPESEAQGTLGEVHERERRERERAERVVDRSSRVAASAPVDPVTDTADTEVAPVREAKRPRAPQGTRPMNAGRALLIGAFACAVVVIARRQRGR